MDLKTFAAEQRVFQEGDPSDYAYIVEYGNVQIYREIGGRAVRLAVLGKGDIFGEMGLVDDRPRSASAKALNDVAVTPIDSAGFVALLRDEPDKTLPIIRVLFERLRTMNDRYIDSLEHVVAAGEEASDHTVKLLPLTAEARARVSVEGLSVRGFPFRVGRAAAHGDSNPLDWNDLSMPDSEPYSLSINHFAVERTEDGIAVRDRGSRFGTIVNGVVIGAEADQNMKALEIGANEVIAGAADSPFRFRLVVEPSSG